MFTSGALIEVEFMAWIFLRGLYVTYTMDIKEVGCWTYSDLNISYYLIIILSEKTKQSG